MKNALKDNSTSLETIKRTLDNVMSQYNVVKHNNCFQGNVVP